MGAQVEFVTGLELESVIDPRFHKLPKNFNRLINRSTAHRDYITILVHVLVAWKAPAD